MRLVGENDSLYVILTNFYVAIYNSTGIFLMIFFLISDYNNFLTEKYYQFRIVNMKKLIFEILIILYNKLYFL